MNLNWQKKDIFSGKMVLRTLDTHTAGEPLRIIIGGMPEIPGQTILEKRRYLQTDLDYIRQALIFEPRGHFDMYGCIVIPPVTEQADLGVLFLHNEGYSTMCGHGIIGLVTALLETGAISSQEIETIINLDTPAGLVRATAHLNPQGGVKTVSFLNVPSFLYKRDLQLDIAEYGTVSFDIAFGGAFYAILPVDQFGIAVTSIHKAELISIAARLKAAIHTSIPIEHPFENDLGFLYGCIFTGLPENPDHHSRNVCVFAASEVDRSPTGTGVSARVALHHAKGEIHIGESIAIESILGSSSVFTGKAAESISYGPHNAIVPEITGSASITGVHQFIIDPEDSLKTGFLI